MSHITSHWIAVLAIASLTTLAVSSCSTPETPQVGAKDPLVGMKSSYKCKGPGSKTKERHYELVSVQDGVRRWNIKVNGKRRWMEKPAKYRGLTLFTKRDRNDGNGVRHQTINEPDFANYEALEPGATFSGYVDESHNKASWTWNYSVVVGAREQTTHALLGPIEITTVREHRKVIGGEYESDMTMTLGINPKAVLGWTYTDRDGTRTCELVSRTPP